MHSFLSDESAFDGKAVLFKFQRARATSHVQY